MSNRPKVVHVTAPSTSGNLDLGNLTTHASIRDALNFGRTKVATTASQVSEAAMEEFAFWTFQKDLTVEASFALPVPRGRVNPERLEPEAVFRRIVKIRDDGMVPLDTGRRPINIDLLESLKEGASQELLKDISEVETALQEANEYANGGLIIKKMGPDPLFSLRKMRTIVRFLLMQPPQKNETGEAWVEHTIGSAIIHLFVDEREWWTASCNTNVALASGLSASTGGARPDIGVQSAVESGNSEVKLTPNAIAFIGEAKKEKVDLKKACRQMAFALHPTMLMLIMDHYRMMEWEYTCPLTKSSLKIFDESSFVFSVFYAANEVTVLANYPYLALSNGKYRWRLGCSVVKTVHINKYPTRRERLSLFFLLAFVEQHAHNLKNRFETDEIASYFNSLHQSSVLLGTA